jgi:hypothetical protein
LIAVENPVEIPLKKVRTGTTLHPNPVPTLNTKAVKVQPHSNNGKKAIKRNDFEGQWVNNQKKDQSNKSA